MNCFHARPSSSARWTECNLSLVLSRQLGLTGGASSKAAEEGTRLHLLAYEVNTGKRGFDELEDETSRLFCRSVAGGGWHFEQRVELFYSPGNFGTIDACQFSPEEKALRIADLKTGRNPVSPEFNLQLGIYAVSLMKETGCNPETVELIIFQAGEAKTWRTTPATLRTLTAPANQAYKDYLDGNIYFCLAVCENCPVLSSCLTKRNIIRLMEKIAKIENIEMVQDVEKVEILKHSDAIRKFLDCLDAELLARYNERGELLPGTKVKEGNRRKIWKLSEQEIIKKYGEKVLTKKLISASAALEEIPEAKEDIEETRNASRIVPANPQDYNQK